MHREKVDFPALTFSLCVSLCVCFDASPLQVVGLDPDQTTLSRGGAAGQGQGSYSGSPEGPPGRHGTAKGLGRKLPGEWDGLELFFTHETETTAAPPDLVF